VKTAVLLGTARYDGNTYKLAQAVQEALDIELFMLKNFTISDYDYEHKNLDDDFLSLVQELLTYDHIVFASPVYWYGMSAPMKKFFDRLSDLITVAKDTGRKLQGKPCSILATGSEPKVPNCFEDSFSLTFNYLGMDYQGILYCNCGSDFEKHPHQQQITSFIDTICA
jgi:multimeric flavodoxin WrbA